MMKKKTMPRAPRNTLSRPGVTRNMIEAGSESVCAIDDGEWQFGRQHRRASAGHRRPMMAIVVRSTGPSAPKIRAETAHAACGDDSTLQLQRRIRGVHPSLASPRLTSGEQIDGAPPDDQQHDAEPHHQGGSRNCVGQHGDERRARDGRHEEAADAVRTKQFGRVVVINEFWSTMRDESFMPKKARVAVGAERRYGCSP